jgi:hypothetical protein
MSAIPSEWFDIEEYARQAEYLKSKSARILNNVFRVSLRKVLKKHLLVVNFEVIFDSFQVTYLRKRSKLIEFLVLKYYFRTC